MKHKLEPDGKFSFSATTGADSTPYEVEFNLFDKVDVNVGVAMLHYLTLSLVNMHVNEE